MVFKMNFEKHFLQILNYNIIEVEKLQKSRMENYFLLKILKSTHGKTRGSNFFIKNSKYLFLLYTIYNFKKSFSWNEEENIDCYNIYYKLLKKRFKSTYFPKYYT